ncbi:DUF2339 domain-containing protein [Melittangium boletus]|uniref:DUF2339 domain-containing protein n=1 Tax=Melittangium boletus TaxID=83453 RepID=UPI003DA62B48
MAEDNSRELSDVVRRLEDTVARLEARIARLEAAPPPPVALPPPPPIVPSAAPAPAPRDLEAHLGTYWLSRAGIVALILGFAFLIIYHFGDLGVLARVGLGYLLSAGLAALGLWLSRRHALFGQILFGGGLALGYFVTYALHFVPAVRVIDSEVLALGLLALNTVAIVVVAHRMRSETVAGIALFLGLHTGMLSDITLFTLLSTALLAAGALFFLVKNRWVIVPLSSLVAVYSTHVVWAMRTQAIAPGGSTGDRLALSLGFLALYYVLFSVALLIEPRELSRRVGLTFALLNWAGLLALGAVEVERWDSPRLFAFFVAVALAQAACGAGARMRGASDALFQTYVATAVLTLALGVPTEFEGATLVRTWTVVGLGAGLAGRTLGASALTSVGVGLLFLALGATWLPPTGRAGLNAGLLVAFVIVERLSVARARQPRPSLQALCALGAGFATVWMLGDVLPPALVTLAWGLAASLLFLLGFTVRERWYRFAGLGVLGLALARLLFVDLSGLPPNQRILTFLVLGALLLAVSFIYTRTRGQKE